MNILFAILRADAPNDSLFPFLASRFFKRFRRGVLVGCIAGFCLSTHGAGLHRLAAAPTHPTAHQDDSDYAAPVSDEAPLPLSASAAVSALPPAPQDAIPPAPQSATPPAPATSIGAAQKTKPNDGAAPQVAPRVAPQVAPRVAPQVAIEVSDEVPVLARDGESLRQAAARLKLPLPLPQGRIVVLKSRRRLELWNGGSLIKTYRVALGAAPQGHKQRQGDKRTPEGEFHVCTRNASTSAFHIFLGLDYPAVPDATRALKNKTISWREYQAIRNRLASRSAPLWGTRLGGWVGIHGGNGGTFARKRAKQRGGQDWTAGCIALRDSEIDELYAATRLGTSVSVRP